MFFLRKS